MFKAYFAFSIEDFCWIADSPNICLRTHIAMTTLTCKTDKEKRKFISGLQWMLCKHIHVFN